jgi:hypothetical protein
MRQVQRANPAINPTPSLHTSQSTLETHMTLWKALEERLQTQLTKHLAELIRRLREPQIPTKGERDERH